jgi:steroid delta-isomerase-like uncharacterized protein
MADLKANSRRTLEEVWNEGKLDVIDELTAPGFRQHDASQPFPIDSPDDFKKLVAAYREAFPDVRFTVEEQVEEGDTVVTRWSAIGTQQGPFVGIPPTGKQASVTGMTLTRFVDGKAVESFSNWDQLALLQQLGVVPSPGG